MAKKILVFLSPHRENAKTQSYLAPDGTTVPGELTNDAPLRYLLRKHPETEELLCITTSMSSKTFQRLEQLLEEDGCAVACRKIDFEESQSFEALVLPVVSAALKPGDSLLLDITGGFRDIMLYLTLLCRIFTYRGIQIEQAVYSNLNPPRILDATHLLQMFDLVGGMQELISFGSVRTLRTYYARQKPNPAIDELLASVEYLKECMDLCRTQKLTYGMERFNRALLAASECDDSMLQILLPVFRSKFGDHIDALQLIRWCVESEMLQQALTIYNELVPELIYGTGKLVYSTWALPVSGKAYASFESNQLTEGVLRMSRWHLEEYNSTNRVSCDRVQLCDALKTPEQRIDLLRLFSGQEDVPSSIPLYILEQLAMVCCLAYGRDCRGSYDRSWIEKLPHNRKYLSNLQGWIEQEGLDTADAFLSGLHRCPGKKLAKLLEQPRWDFLPYRGKKSCYGKSLECLGELLPLFGYASTIPIGDLQHILVDFLYVRTLRNMANHANDSSTADQKQQLDDLAAYQYPDPEKIGRHAVERILLNAIDRLERALQQSRRQVP